MKKIMTVLLVCLALSTTTGAYGSNVPVSPVNSLAGFPGEQIGMAVDLVQGDLDPRLAGRPIADSPDLYPSGITAKVFAADDGGAQVNAAEEDEEGEKKGETDDEKDQGGPDRMWDAGKLG
jgi:hypothetical protein